MSLKHAPARDDDPEEVIRSPDRVAIMAGTGGSRFPG
jgi:hypothetical protein